MTTLDTKDDKVQSPAATVEKATDTAALITEQQVMFASAPALTPPTTHRWSRAAHAVAAPLFAMFKPAPRAHNHYPQRLAYLENSAMSREMDRL